MGHEYEVDTMVQKTHLPYPMHSGHGLQVPLGVPWGRTREVEREVNGERGREEERGATGEGVLTRETIK